MYDPRKIRQTFQTILALAMIVAPVALAQPFDWRALVVATLGGIMAVVTNPRLVAGLANAMPISGSAILPPEVEKPSGLKTSGGPSACAVVLILGALLLSGSASAQDVPAKPQLGFKAGTYTTCQPATAAGMQLNIKTQSWQRFSFLQGFGCTYRGWAQPVGVAAYVGYAAANDGTSGYQGALLVSYADVLAVGPGVQTYLDPSTRERIYQGTVNLVGNFSWGASMQGLSAREKSARLNALAGK